MTFTNRMRRKRDCMTSEAGSEETLVSWVLHPQGNQIPCKQFDDFITATMWRSPSQPREAPWKERPHQPPGILSTPARLDMRENGLWNGPGMSSADESTNDSTSSCNPLQPYERSRKNHQLRPCLSAEPWAILINYHLKSLILGVVCHSVLDIWNRAVLDIVTKR